MSDFSTIILAEDFDSEQEDSWKVSVADSSFYNDKLVFVSNFAKKHNLNYVIKDNTIQFFTSDVAAEDEN